MVARRKKLISEGTRRPEVSTATHITPNGPQVVRWVTELIRDADDNVVGVRCIGRLYAGRTHTSENTKKKKQQQQLILDGRGGVGG